VFAGFQHGEQYVKANDAGYWSMWLYLYEMDPGSTANVRVTSAASESVYEFGVAIPDAEPVDVSFAANSGEGDHSGDPIWHRFSGTAQPGSGVIASSAYGVEDVGVGESGEWTLKLWMNDVPAGSEFKVTITNTVSEASFSFWLETPVAEEPAPEVAFSANAFYVTCDLIEPYNDYWGTAQPGSVVKILSPYGSAEVVANGDGNWEKRVHFSGTTIGETFNVKVKSYETGQYVEFPFTHTPAD
jgi:hypothetical protein